MAAYSTGKTAWFRFLASFLAAGGTALLLCTLVSGPRLGRLYDFLLARRPPPPVTGELLIIDTSGGSTSGEGSSAGDTASAPGGVFGENILEPGTAASLLYTLAEFGARTLIIQVPVLGLSAGGTAGEEEILYRFDEEFSLLSDNIRNLFEAIRTGSVGPRDAARYVGELVGLSEQGKERLVAALVRRDGEGVARMEKAAAFFGDVRRPGDLQVQLILASGPGGGSPGALAEKNGYSRALPDRDGVLRRIMPVLSGPVLTETPGEAAREHIIYRALASRYARVEIEPAGSALFKGPVLALKGGPRGEDTRIPLDRDGAVLFRLPRGGEGFRRAGIADFLAYDEADRELRRLLSEGGELGIFQGIEGEDNPAILYDSALALRDGPEPDGDSAALEKRRLDWIAARNRYLAGLEEFLYGPAEMNLVTGYEEIAASGPLTEDALAGIPAMRDSLIRAFVELRERHYRLMELRAKLEKALPGSFCILGSAPALAPADGEGLSGGAPAPRRAGFTGWVKKALMPGRALTGVEASALLANSILTGRVIIPGQGIFLLVFSAFPVFLACFFLKPLRPAPTLGMGALFTLFTAAVFPVCFIVSGTWLDPLVPAGACAAGVMVSYAWALVARGRYARRFRLAFGPFVSRQCLKSVMKAGGPLPGRIITVRAAVVAVTNSPERHARAAETLAFQERVSALIKQAGGALTGIRGGTVYACFGSPLERVFMKGGKTPSPYEDSVSGKDAPAVRAVDFVMESARLSGCASWRFGLDTGDCTFTWTAAAGYSASGVPVQKADALSRAAGRYKARALMSAAVHGALPDMAAEKPGVFKDSAGVPGEPFYRLAV